MMEADIRCPLCGGRMREVRGRRSTTRGTVERRWQCPACLHEERTVERLGPSRSE